MSNVRTEQSKLDRPVSSAGDSPTALRLSSDSISTPSYTSTLMESLFIGDWGSMNIPQKEELPYLITYWANRWVSALELSTQYDSFTVHVLADLVKHHDVELAVSFLPLSMTLLINLATSTDPVLGSGSTCLRRIFALPRIVSFHYFI